MYRTEYPRPDFVRKNWINLNGQWEFALCTDKPADIFASVEKKIEVPFCPESKLSGIGFTDFISCVQYRKTIELTTEALTDTLLLHFGAVDYKADVYVNKKLVGTHSGGYTPFSFEIQDYAAVGQNVIDVVVFDDTRSLSIPSGKQSTKKDSYFCFYTRTTGIWQTVWLESLSKNYLRRPKITSTVDSKTIRFEGECKKSAQLEIAIFLDGVLQKKNGFEIGKTYDVSLTLNDIVLWDTENPVLYDIELRLFEEDVLVDCVTTYCAFRTTELRGKHFYLNDKKTVLKQVLDQGFYKDGIYTAKNVDDIERDIDLMMGYGFNGARPHMKVFDPYYFYYADKKGYLVFGEFPNWCCDFRQKKAGFENLMREWKEVLERDYNHPSIIGWCPLNETWRWTKQKCDYVSQVKLVAMTKAFDNTRMVIGSSGGDIYCGDVWDYHTYTHNAKKLKKIIADSRKNYVENINMFYCFDRSKKLKYSNYSTLPQFLSEYGGLTFKQAGKTWGYSKALMTEKEFVDMFIALTDVALDSDIMGICYTQAYDVEQEQNGLLTYDREHKLTQKSIERIRDCLQVERN